QDSCSELVEGHFADPLSGRREYRIGERWCGRRNRRLPQTSHFGIVLKPANFDNRTLVDPHGFVADVSGLLHRALCVSEFAIDRVAEPPDDASLHLILEVDGIDDLADIGRNPDLVDSDASVRRRHFDDFGYRCPKRLDERDTTALAMTKRSLP